MKNNQFLKQFKKLPKPAQQIYLCCDTCIKKLMKNGSSFKEAEASVYEVLKEHELHIKEGNHKHVIASMNLIFEIDTLANVAKSIRQ